MPNSVEKCRRTLGIVMTRGFTPPAEERSCRPVVYGVWATFCMDSRYGRGAPIFFSGS